VAGVVQKLICAPSVGGPKNEIDTRRRLALAPPSISANIMAIRPTILISINGRIIIPCRRSGHGVMA
jgi:hypothetical protein